MKKAIICWVISVPVFLYQLYYHYAYAGYDDVFFPSIALIFVILGFIAAFNEKIRKRAAKFDVDSSVDIQPVQTINEPTNKNNTLKLICKVAGVTFEDQGVPRQQNLKKLYRDKPHLWKMNLRKQQKHMRGIKNLQVYAEDGSHLKAA